MAKVKTTAASVKTFGTKPQERKLFNYDPSDGVNIKTNISESAGYIEYGAKDSFPNYLMDTVSKSHTCFSCIDTRSSFIEGRLKSESLSNMFVNSDGDTFEEVHHRITADYSQFEGAYIHLSYNLKKEITKIQHLPFEYCRLGLPNEFGRITYIVYNPYFGTPDFQKEENVIFPIFNPDESVLDGQMGSGNFNGQVMFIKEERPGSRFYPVPYYWSGHYWFDVERKIGEFHNSNIDNNFLLSVLIKFVGDPNQGVEFDDEGNVKKTIKQVIDEQLENKYSGKDKGGVVMTLWGDSKEAFPEIESFPTNTHDSLFTALQELLKENITVATNIPPILANINVSKGLSNDDITNSVALLQGKIQKTQNKLEATYSKIFKKSIWGEQDATLLPFEYGAKEVKVETGIGETDITVEN